MPRELKSGRVGPKTAQSAIVFLHGYGADGADLLSLSGPLAPHFPQTVFYSPDAPEPCVNNPMGRQWFPIPWLDGSTEAQARQSAAASFADVNAFLDKVLADERLTPDRLAVVGFSQGTMMALHVAPRRDTPVAGVVGFSGRLLDPEASADEVVSRPPILLCHGDQDQMVPFADMANAERALKAAGFDVRTFVMKGTGHGISPEGLGAAVAFLTQVLPD
ncbi:MAG: phospholipase [Paracoccus denitrificans]|nr:MAG: phospholipase [Paracoccus denitrificans]PZO84041.1 MAG: phospholipase [Paracoccus denitrificans]